MFGTALASCFFILGACHMDVQRCSVLFGYLLDSNLFSRHITVSWDFERRSLFSISQKHQASQSLPKNYLQKKA